MTTRAKTRGLTAWANMRLNSFEQSTNNIVSDLTKGVYMKYLLQSYTGTKDEKFQSFDNLTKEQLQTRIKWFTKELKTCGVLPDAANIDPKQVSVRSAKEVFDMFWYFICYDISFLWERIGFLSNINEEVLIKVPFTWIPVPPVEKTKPTSNRELSQMSVMSLFGGNSRLGDNSEEDKPEEKSKQLTSNDKFPGYDIMKAYDTHAQDSFIPNPEQQEQQQSQPPPDPKTQVKEMINIQLKTIEGKKFVLKRFSDLSDTRVLCGLVNTFVPYLLPIEILIRDRWCLNLTLRTIDRILNCESTFDSEDLVEADSYSICAFFCYLFMMLFKYKQCQAVVNKYKYLEINVRKATKCLLNESLDPQEKTNLEQTLADLKYGMQELQDKYDMKFFFKWVERVQNIRNDIYDSINSKLNLRFDSFSLQEDIAPVNLCANHAVNLSFTNGLAFYKLTQKETISRSRVLILKERKNNSKFIFDLKSSSIILEKILRVQNSDPIELDPKNYPDYEIFIEVYSNSKLLKSGTIFCYQVFPTNIAFYHNFLLKAVLEKDFESVKRMIDFFSKFNASFINLIDPVTQNTALHLAAETGYFKILHFLLENYSSVNSQNKDGLTPLFFAVSAKLKDSVKLLLEYGADPTIKTNKNETLIKIAKGEEYKKFLTASFQRYQNIASTLVNGNRDSLEQVINQHVSGQYRLCTLRSRFICGSTLLHTSAAYDHIDLVEKLLILNDFDLKTLNPNIRDAKGATALHKTNHVEIIRTLVNYGAEINARDLDGNIPLHNKCLGEKGKPTELEAIRILLQLEADFTVRNKKNMLPLHLAAQQGRLDAIELLNECDKNNKMIRLIENETEEETCSSPTYLALTNDYLACAGWLTRNGFYLKKGEAESVMIKVLTEKIIVKDLKETITFLCVNGCDLKYRYENGNTALHYASLIPSGEPHAVKILLKYGAFVNTINDEMKSPLFNSVTSNNPLAAAALLAYNADYKIRNSEGNTAFDLVKDITEWIKNDCFDSNTKEILKSYEYKHTRFLVKSIAEKVKLDFGARAKLMERKKILGHYITHHENVVMNKNAPLSRSQSAFPKFDV